MKALNELIIEALVYDSEREKNNAKQSKLKSCVVDGWKVIVDRDHPASQAVERHPTKTESDWVDFHSKAISGLKASASKGNHVIISKSHEHGIVYHVHRKNKELRVITVLGKHQTKSTHPDDTKMIVEYVK